MTLSRMESPCLTTTCTDEWLEGLHFDTAAKALAALADRLSGAGAPVETVPPAGATTVRVCLWPLALLPEREGRGGAGSAPVRLRVRFLVTVDGPAAAALSTMDRLLRTVAEPGGYPPVPEAVDPAVWRAFGVDLRI